MLSRFSLRSSGWLQTHWVASAILELVSCPCLSIPCAILLQASATLSRAISLLFLLWVTRADPVLLHGCGGNLTIVPAQASQRSPVPVPTGVISSLTSRTPLPATTEFTFDLLDLSLPRTECPVDRALGTQEVVTAASCPVGPQKASGWARLTCLRLTRLHIWLYLSPRTAVKPGWLKRHSCHQLSVVLEAEVGQKDCGPRRLQGRRCPRPVSCGADGHLVPVISHCLPLSECPLTCDLVWFYVFFFRQSLGSQTGFEL